MRMIYIAIGIRQLLLCIMCGGGSCLQRILLLIRQGTTGDIKCHQHQNVRSLPRAIARKTRILVLRLESSTLQTAGHVPAYIWKVSRECHRHAVGENRADPDTNLMQMLLQKDDTVCITKCSPTTLSQMRCCLVPGGQKENQDKESDAG